MHQLGSVAVPHGDWEAIVDAYLEGRRPEAGERVLALTPNDLALITDVFDAWIRRARLVYKAPPSHQSPLAADLRRMAVRRLQASAALPVEVLVPLSGRVTPDDTVRVLEEVAINAIERLSLFESTEVELPEDRQRRMPDEIRRDLAHFRARWHVAYLQFLVNAGRFGDARTIAARIRLPDDDPLALAEAHYLRGLIEESIARLVDERAVRRAAEEPLPASRLPSFIARLRDAAGWYGRALEARPSHQEARLHLGRVELERGRQREAIDVLGLLREARNTTWIDGLAWLFTGDAHEALGEHADAAAAYGQAARVAEVRQSALVASTQLALRRGDTTQVVEFTSQFAGPWALASDDAPDAWTAYLSRRRADSEAVLHPLREVMLP